MQLSRGSGFQLPVCFVHDVPGNLSLDWRLVSSGGLLCERVRGRLVMVRVRSAELSSADRGLRVTDCSYLAPGGLWAVEAYAKSQYHTLIGVWTLRYDSMTGPRSSAGVLHSGHKCSQSCCLSRCACRMFPAWVLLQCR